MKIRLALSQILLDESTQCRERTDPALVEEYASAYKREEDLPAPDVFGPLDEESLPPGAQVWIGDGHTRVRGALAADLAYLTCEVHPGGEEDAFAFALRANRRHGARVTAADKRHAVKKALERWPGLSSREIAKRADVGKTLVEEARKTLEATGRGGQLREGADGKARRLPQRTEPEARERLTQELDRPYAPLFPTGLGPELAGKPPPPCFVPLVLPAGELEIVPRTATPGATTLVQDEALAEEAPRVRAATKATDPYDPAERLALLRAAPCLKDVPEAERAGLADALREMAEGLAPGDGVELGVPYDDLRARAEAAEANVAHLSMLLEKGTAEWMRGTEKLAAAEVRVRELEQEAAMERSASCGACELAAERIKDLEQQVRRLEAKAERLTEATADLLAGEAPAPAPLRVALVGCGAKKLDHAAPARELYTGPLFRAALAYAEDEGYDAIFVLSAKHGFVRLGDKLEPYDQHIEGLPPVERKALGLQVIAALAVELEGEPAEITVLAAEGYVALLDGAPWKVHAPLAGLQIGERLAWFKQQREGEPAAPPAPVGALSVKCPQCKAKPGQPCKNYKGQGCALHAMRAAAVLAACGAKHPTGPAVCGRAPHGAEELHRGEAPHGNVEWQGPLVEQVQKNIEAARATAPKKRRKS